MNLNAAASGRRVLQVMAGFACVLVARLAEPLPAVEGEFARVKAVLEDAKWM
jgi:hypothetical protein